MESGRARRWKGPVGHLLFRPHVRHRFPVPLLAVILATLTGASLLVGVVASPAWSQWSDGPAAADTPVVVRDGTWYLRKSNTTGSADITFRYGDAGDIPVMGDWNGDGVDTPGVVRGNEWYLRNSNTTGTADLTFLVTTCCTIYGNAGYQPVVGDWNGDGTDTPGLVSGNTWFLRNSNTTGTADLTFGYGNVDDRPLVGDWDADGFDTPGVVRGNTWYLRNANSTGTAHVAFSYGNVGDTLLEEEPKQRQAAGPVGQASTDTVETGGFPFPEGDTALLVDVRVGRHEGFERIVLEFEGDDPPGYRVGYIDPPVRADGSGHVVELAGEAFLEVRAVPALPYDPMSDEARRTYTGPDRFTPEGTELIEELVMTAGFEANLAWVAGLSERAPFAVKMLQDPLRLVVDVVPTGNASPPSAECTTVGFTPNSDDVASSIVATGLSCDEAEAFVRKIGPSVGPFGPARIELDGFECVLTRTDDTGLPHGFFECTSGSKRITFVRS